MNATTENHIGMKEAVAIAKAFVSDLFLDERIQNIELDEADFGARTGDWFITISFQKGLDQKQHNALAIALQRVAKERKTVRINRDSGQVVSVTNFKPLVSLA
jgi:hypothetical protein